MIRWVSEHVFGYSVYTTLKSNLKKVIFSPNYQTQSSTLETYMANLVANILFYYLLPWDWLRHAVLTVVRTIYSHLSFCWQSISLTYHNNYNYKSLLTLFSEWIIHQWNSVPAHSEFSALVEKRLQSMFICSLGHKEHTCTTHTDII